MTGYELRQQIEATIGHFWRESFGQLYPALRELEGEGLVRQTDTAQRRIPYRITLEGRDALRRWLVAEPESTSAERNALLLRVVLGRHAPPGVIRGHLERHRAEVEATLERHRSTEAMLLARDGVDADYWAAGVRHSIAVAEASLAWTARTLVDLPDEGNASHDAAGRGRREGGDAQGRRPSRPSL